MTDTLEDLGRAIAELQPRYPYGQPVYVQSDLLVRAFREIDLARKVVAEARKLPGEGGSFPRFFRGTNAAIEAYDLECKP